MCSTSDENLDNMDETTKRLMMAHVKSAVDTRRRFREEPPEWLNSLPDSPLQLMQEYPDTFRVAFGSSSQSSPLPCPIDMTKLLAFDQSYGCRGGARHVPAVVAGPRRVLARQPSEQGPAERMASLFMGRMENIFSSMMANGGGNGGLTMGRGLSALANSSDLGRRMPTIDFGQPGGMHDFGQPGGMQLALPAPLARVLPAAALSDDSLQPIVPQLQLAADSDLDASGEVAGMLDMLAAREGEKNSRKSSSSSSKSNSSSSKSSNDSGSSTCTGSSRGRSRASSDGEGQGPEQG